MRFIVCPHKEPDFKGRWKWELIDGETGQVFATGDPESTPKAARTAATEFRRSVFMAPVEMGT